MAAIISTELLHYISPALVFIFIWSILYVVMQKFEAFGKNQPINAAISFAASLLFLLTPIAQSLILEVVPWFVTMVLILVIILLVLMFMGYKEVDIVSYMKKERFGVTVATIVILLFLVALAKVVGPSLYQYPASTDLGIFADMRRIIFNPKVLGAVFILVVIAKFIHSITYPVEK